MRKFLPYILILIALIGFLSPITNVKAQDGTSNYTLLAPLPDLTTFDASAGEDNSKLGEYLNLMIKLFIGICSVLAVIMIVIGGIEYMTSELMHSKEHGKERIRGAILGLILALGAYTILYTINPDLLNTDFKSLESVEVEVDLNVDVPQPRPASGQTYTNTNYKFGDPWPGTPSVLVGVAVSPTGDCATVGQENCTSLKGLQVGILRTIKSNCPNCQLVVTGGTEFWLHKVGTSHNPGSSTVDLRLDANLNIYITGGQPLVKKRYLKDGISYLYEGNHWHAGP